MKGHPGGKKQAIFPTGGDDTNVFLKENFSMGVAPIGKRIL